MPAGGDDDHLDIDCDFGAVFVVGVAGEFARDDGERADFVFDGAGDGPGDFGGVRGDAAEDFAAEVFEDFGAALGPPRFGGFDGAAVVEFEGVGVVGEGVGDGFVVVGLVGGAFAAGGAGAEVGEAELAEHVLVVFGGGPGDGRRGGGEEGGERQHQGGDGFHLGGG